MVFHYRNIKYSYFMCSIQNYNIESPCIYIQYLRIRHSLREQDHQYRAFWTNSWTKKYMNFHLQLQASDFHLYIPQIFNSTNQKYSLGWNLTILYSPFPVIIPLPVLISKLETQNPFFVLLYTLFFTFYHWLTLMN